MPLRIFSRRRRSQTLGYCFLVAQEPGDMTSDWRCEHCKRQVPRDEVLSNTWTCEEDGDR